MGLDQYVLTRQPKVRNNPTGTKLLSVRKLRKMSKRRRKVAMRDADSLGHMPRGFCRDWRFRGPRSVWLRKARKPARTWYRLISGDIELLYWRKFNPLQGWFEQHYNLENCDEVNITPELLDRLEADMNAGALRTTTGFLYGGEWEQHEIVETLTPGIAEMRQALAEGKSIYYTCWY